MTNRELPNVFRYLDYRLFLRDYYLAGKERGLSYRSISRRAAVRSSNYFKLIIEGQRNISDEMAVRFGKAVTLEGSALEFFCELVRFNQAKTQSARSAAYESLSRFRNYRTVRKLELAHGEYHSRWYLPAIRELANRSDFVSDPKWIADTLCPTIKVSEARRALEVLVTLGLLRADEERGRLVVAETLVTTGPEARGVHVANYHREMLKMGGESLDRFPPDDRDISGLTLCLSDDAIGELKKRVGRFRRELLELSEVEPNPARVVQVSFQIFPLTKKKSK